MNRILFLLILSFGLPKAYSQTSTVQRFISYANLSDAKYLPASNIQADLFNAAEKGLLKLYRFDSFDKAPRIISQQQLISEIYPPWKKKMNYTALQYDGYTVFGQASFVVYQNKLYQSLIENKGKLPTDTLTWEEVTSTDFDATIIGLDYEVARTDSTLQYVHFYRDGLKYIASFKASDAIKYLNASGIVWYQSKNYFAGHVTGSIFLFDRWSWYKTGNDLRPLLDTVKLKSNNQSPDDFSLRSVQIKDEKISDFILCNEDKVCDTVSISRVMRFLDTSQPEFLLMGDALAMFRMFKDSGFKKLKLEPFKNSEKMPAREKIELINFTQVDEFYFRYQQPDKKFMEDMYKFVNLIFQGVSENRINVYKSDDLQVFYTPQELVQYWMEGEVENWDGMTFYDVNDNVIFNQVYYSSLANSNVENTPSENPDKWQPNRIAIVQPSQVMQLNFVRHITLDNTGKIVSNEIHSIELKAASGYATNISKGHLNYTQVKNFIAGNNARLWEAVTRWIKQNGVFEIQSSLLTVKK